MRWVLRNGSSWVVVALLVGTIGYAIAEEVTLTTYYPSPRGVYRELQTTANTFLATQTGNVGIGVTSAGSKLVVAPPALGPGGVGAAFLGNVTGGNIFTAQAQITASGSNTPARLNFGDGPSALVTAQLESSHIGSGGGYLALKTRESSDVNLLERLRVDADGNVGIGLFAPSQKLDVAGTVQVTGFKMPTGAITNYVLTADAAGVARWAPVPGQSLTTPGPLTFGTPSPTTILSKMIGFHTFCALSRNITHDAGSQYGMNGCAVVIVGNPVNGKQPWQLNLYHSPGHPTQCEAVCLD